MITEKRWLALGRSTLAPCPICASTGPCKPESDDPCEADRPDRRGIRCVRPKGHGGMHRGVCLELVQRR